MAGDRFSDFFVRIALICEADFDQLISMKFNSPHLSLMYVLGL